MGLLKAGVGALKSVLADQWRDYFYSEALAPDVLATRGVKKVTGRSSNTKSDDNIISNGSIVAVNDGQCMLIVEQGKVVEVCAEPGEFVYDTSSEPSIFYGNLGENIKNSFSTFGKRFGFGGDTAKDQRIYYFNTKEIIGNKYGTQNPVPFRVVDKNIGLDVDISVRCNGEYSYKIVDPVLFYTNVCGNITGTYLRSEIDSQLKAELLSALQPAFAEISEMGIRYSAVPGHASELCEILDRELTEKWQNIRGLKIVSVAMNSITAPKEDEDMIKNLQKTAVMRDPSMAAAHLVTSQGEAMVGAANNENAGSVMAFAGMNMAAQAGGMNAQNLFEMANANKEQKQPDSADGSWVCSCGQKNKAAAKFCSECGTPKPADGWTCSCGAVNKGKFCSECGKAKPAGAFLYRCDRCGWKPEDPANPPKFCPECGDPFDENDRK